MILSVLLLILKIIGITLLCILGLILLIIGIVLFTPIRYKLVGDFQGKDIKAKASISFFFHLLNVHFDYPDKPYIRVRIGPFTVKSLMKKDDEITKQKKPKKRKSDDVKPSELLSEELVRDDVIEKLSEEEPVRADEIETPLEEELVKEEVLKRLEQADQETSITAETENETEMSENGSTDSENEANEANEAVTLDEEELETVEDITEDSSEAFSEKIKTLFEAIKSKVQAVDEHIQKLPGLIRKPISKIRYTIKGLCDKINEMRDNVNYYKGVVTGSQFKKAFSLVKDELKRIFKSLAPRKCKIYLHIGMEDPATTAKIMQVYGITLPLKPKRMKVKLIPEFEQEILEGDVYISGKISIIVVVIALIRLYFSKNIRKVIKLFKKEE